MDAERANELIALGCGLVLMGIFAVIARNLLGRLTGAIFGRAMVDRALWRSRSGNYVFPIAMGGLFAAIGLVCVAVGIFGR